MEMGKYTLKCSNTAAEASKFLDIYYYSSSQFHGTFKRSEVGSQDDFRGIDVFEYLDKLTRKVDEKTYISAVGADINTFILEISQYETNYFFSRTNYKEKGWLLQNKYFSPSKYKKENDYYKLVFINKLKNGDKIVFENISQVETILFKVENLRLELEKVGVPFDKLEEATQICTEKFLSECKKNKKTKRMQFSFEEILGIRLKNGYEGKKHGKCIYFSVSKLPADNGYSIPVNIVVPKEFYINIPGAEHLFIKSN